MWYYNNKPYEEVSDPKLTGFVYKITNIKNGRMYIGKKTFWMTKTKQVNKKKKKYKAESDWKEYYGSNEELQKDVEKLGPDCFRRDILHLCTTKGEASYLEAKEQFATDCILSPNYYNVWLSVRVRASHVKHMRHDQADI